MDRNRTHRYDRRLGIIDYWSYSSSLLLRFNLSFLLVDIVGKQRIEYIKVKGNTLKNQMIV